MTQDELNFFKRWFSDYCKSFYSSDIEDQKNISLKEEHTFQVCKNILDITKGLSLGDNDMRLAEAAALFHDIGRFPQYAKYKTFQDSISINHGLLGGQTLIEEKILNNLPDDEQELIIEAVRFHNAFSIPEKKKEKIIFFLKLIRDADKLDIWRVFTEYYESPEGKRASAAGLGLPEGMDYSEEVLQYIYKGHIAPISKVKTLNDLKLIQLSWVYDLNLKISFELLLKRGYIDRIILTLPQRDEIKKVASVLKEFIYQYLINS